MNYTDTEMLVEKAKNGDMSAIDKLYRAYYDPVLKFVIKIGLNEYDAQDIVSDSFMEVMNHIGQLRDNSSFSSWLYTIAKRKALEFLKKESRHQRVYEGDTKTRIFPYKSDKEHEKFDESSYNEYKKELFGSSDIKTISMQDLEGAMTADEALNYLLEN